MPITLPGRDRSHPRPLAAAAVAVALAVAWAVAFVPSMRAAEPPPSAPVLVESVHVDVEQGDGRLTRGRLERIDQAGVRLVDDAGTDAPALLPGDRVRAVRRTSGGQERPFPLVLTLVDGSTLAGDDFAWDGKKDGKQPAVLLRPEGRIELPVGRIRSIAWRRGAGEAAPQAAMAPAAWQAAIPDGTESDLVVVGTDDNPEFVQCAITGVSAESVTVVLDEETIPVKRSKVIGLEWLRGEPGAQEGTAGRIVVAVSGGEIRARRVEWSPDALVIDGEIRLPAAMLSAIDYAAGRTVGLAGLEPEKVQVEPWFGGLVRPGGDAGLGAFFAPRKIAPAAEQAAPAATARPQPGMIMRPRTVAVWRVPADSRRFRTVVAAAAGSQAADPVLVTVAVDDRELFRRQLGAATTSTAAPPADDDGIPIDIDLTSSRRLTVTVDFVPGNGIGGAVRFTNPVIER